MKIKKQGKEDTSNYINMKQIEDSPYSIDTESTILNDQKIITTYYIKNKLENYRNGEENLFSGLIILQISNDFKKWFNVRSKVINLIQKLILSCYEANKINRIIIVNAKNSEIIEDPDSEINIIDNLNFYFTNEVIDTNLKNEIPLEYISNNPNCPVIDGKVIVKSKESASISVKAKNIDDNNFISFKIKSSDIATVNNEDQLRIAILDSTFNLIIIGNNVELTRLLEVNREVIIDGKNNEIVGDFIFNESARDGILENITIDGTVTLNGDIKLIDVKILEALPIDDLAVSSKTDTTVDLTFSAPTGAKSVTAQFSTDGTSWSSAAIESLLDAASTSAKVISLTENTQYHLKLVVVDEKKTRDSNIVEVKTNSVPIDDLAVSSKTDTTVDLTFTAPTGATSVEVRKSTDGTSWSSAALELPLDAGSTSAKVINLSENTQYYFKLVVVGGKHEGDSNIIDVITNSVPIDDLAVSAKTDTTVDLIFTAPTGATSVEVQKSTDGTSWSSAIVESLLDDTSTSAKVISLNENTHYYFKLVVVGGKHEGDSNIVNVTTEEKIEFPDDNLERCIREKIRKPSGDIYKSDVENITALDASDKNISNIEGIQYLTNLTTFLYLFENNIADITPLSGLTNLTGLHLGNNQIIDISSLSGLIKLTGLNLRNNQIIDINSLSGLTNLTRLFLSNNNITHINSLLGLTKLTYLDLGNNNIIDINPLSGLTNLTGLDLSNNNITDINPLSRLTNLTRLFLSNNNITDYTPVAAYYDNLIYKDFTILIIDLAVSSKTDKTVDLTFTAPTGATSVEVQKSTDGTSWSSAALESPLDAASRSAKVISLSENTQYYFKLVVVGGKHAGDSNIVDVTTEI